MKNRRPASGTRQTPRLTRAAAAIITIAVCLLLSGCWTNLPQATFTLEVSPRTITDLPQASACVFLVSLRSAAAGALQGPVNLAATSSAGRVSLSSDRLAEGDVAELTVESQDAAVGSTVTVSVTAQRSGETHTTDVSAQITDPIESADDRLATAATIRDAFLPWIASEHPELGIDNDTAWTAFPLRPHILEVSYGLFQSAEWELAIWWHVTIAPHDWARMYLRRRFSETAPSFAAEIASFSTGGPPVEIDPPEQIWR